MPEREPHFWPFIGLYAVWRYWRGRKDAWAENGFHPQWKPWVGFLVFILLMVFAVWFAVTWTSLPSH